MHCINFAHRGASAYAPENTLAAFYLGLEMGADGIETDIQQTRDGVLVLFHDNTLERILGRPERIADCTYSELLAMDFGAHMQKPKYLQERIVTLDTFMRYLGRKPVQLALEIKQAGIGEAVVAALMPWKQWHHITLTSFDWDNLVVARACAPDAEIGFLAREGINAALLDRMAQAGFQQACPRIDLLTAEGMALARARGFSVRPWGVKTEALMRHGLALGVDGMTVNFPDKLTEALAAR